MWIALSVLSIFSIGLLFTLGMHPTLAGEIDQHCDVEFSNSGALRSVPVARTLAQQSKGLSGVDDVGNGMLFVFPEAGNLVFWMKGTRVPLSIAFISSGGEILRIQDMEPFSEKYHFSGKPALMALEVRQGVFSQLGVKAGDSLKVLKCE